MLTVTGEKAEKIVTAAVDENGAIRGFGFIPSDLSFLAHSMVSLYLDRSGAAFLRHQDALIPLEARRIKNVCI